MRLLLNKPNLRMTTISVGNKLKKERTFLVINCPLAGILDGVLSSNDVHTINLKCFVQFRDCTQELVYQPEARESYLHGYNTLDWTNYVLQMFPFHICYFHRQRYMANPRAWPSKDFRAVKCLSGQAYHVKGFKDLTLVTCTITV